MASEKLSLRTKIGFGIGDIGGNALFTIMAFWLLSYLTDTVKLPAALAGIALWVGKIWDAVTDPVMGYVSDKTRTRWGRRRPYIFIGGIVALLAMVIMFLNPHFSQTQQGLAFVWAIAAYCLLCLAFTIFNIPYSALTPDLTSDFNERTSLNGWRMSFAIIGTLIAAGAFLPIVGMFTPAGSTDQSSGYLAAGVIYGVIIMGVSFITVFSVRESRSETLPDTSRLHVVKSYLSALKNRPYLLVLFPYALNMIGTTIISQTMKYYFERIFPDETVTLFMFSFKGVEITVPSLLIMLLCTMIFIPLWVPLIKRLGKNISYAIGLFIVAAVCIVVFLFATSLGALFVLIMMIVAGLGLAATYVAPWTMIPDTIEYDYVTTGIRKEGTYYGMWTFFSKTGQALAALVGGLVLQFTNYNPDASRQAPETLLGIRFLLGPIPALVLILGGIVILFYPINQKKYNEIMAASREMRAKG